MRKRQKIEAGNRVVFRKNLKDSVTYNGITFFESIHGSLSGESRIVKDPFWLECDKEYYFYVKGFETVIPGCWVKEVYKNKGGKK